MRAYQRMTAGQLARLSDGELHAMLITACDGETEKLDRIGQDLEQATELVDTSAAASAPFWTDCED